MIQLSRGMSDDELGALAGLEQRVVYADGGRLKLEWRTLQTRSGDDVSDLLWWDGERLSGFLGLYAFGESTVVEIAGMVDPRARRRGIATALLEAALPICRARGVARAFLVTPRGPDAGRAFALHRGAVLEHSEHALMLRDAPTDGPSDPRVTVRAATVADIPIIVELADTAFGSPSPGMAERLAQDPASSHVIELDGAAVGTIRISREGDTAGIYGFAIGPAWQGRGIGRDVLRRVCRQLRDEGISRIGLEVALENDHALRLYTSLGFAQVTTEDYYELRVRD